MAKYFKIATTQVRPLQYKNCYDWSIVRFEENTGLCYYRIGSKINISSLSEVLTIHKKATIQKPYNVKPVQIAEFWGLELSLIDYAAENLIESKIIDENITKSALPYMKQWAGYNLKNVNDLSFIK